MRMRRWKQDTDLRCSVTTAGLGGGEQSGTPPVPLPDRGSYLALQPKCISLAFLKQFTTFFAVSLCYFLSVPPLISVLSSH